MSLLHTLSFALACTIILHTTGLPLQGCQHAGKDYAEGSEVTMVDPCVRCRCSRGSLVCRLRVCNPLPHPPPPGCLVLTRRTECCPRLVCNHGPEESNRRRLSDDFIDGRNSLNGCTVNGTVYAEGSAMDSSTRCNYCYCIKGQQHCVKPQCLLLDSECTPSFTSESCCPTKYNCSKQKNDLPTTTIMPTSGCEVDGAIYPEGELIPKKGQACENCYCLKGRLHCEPVVCSVPVNRRCVPVVTSGHCCPTSYNCSGDNSLRFKEDQLYNEVQEDMIALNTHNHLHVNSERSITGSAKNSENKEHLIQTTQPVPADTTSVAEETSTMAETTTMIKEEPTTVEEETTETTETTTFETPATTDGDTTVIPSTTVAPDLSDVEERINSKGKDDLTMTTSKAEEVTTQKDLSSSNLTAPINNTTNNTAVEGINKHTSSSGPNKSLSSEIEAILNKTKLVNNEEDYDYDYNEPSLPPSLPNLRIIPFVAADAVVDEPVYSPALEKSHSADDSASHFYEIPHSSGFSPPSETEGGFVPKEPLLDGPFYESKYDTVYHSSGAALATATLASLPAITEPPKTAEEVDKCMSGGRSYRHGELLTEPSACDLCVCYYGKILCQEPKCPVPDAGCHLSNNRESGSCCRKIVCTVNNIESPTRVVEHVTPAAHLPPFTVADVIVTPDPFRDVIRTEPAPDLPSLIGDIMPYLWDQTSSTTPVSLTTSEPLNNNTANIILTTTHPETSTAVLSNKVSTLEPISTTTQKIVAPAQMTPPASDGLKNNSEVTTKASDEYDYKEVKEEETSDDEFSLDSVFSYLFDSDKWTTQKPKTTVKPNISKIQHLKPSLTSEPKLNESIPLVEQSLEHRSDEDVNKLSEVSITSETESIFAKSSTTHNILDDNNMQAVTEIANSTRITAKPEVHHTTLRNVLTKSTKRTPTKPATTHSQPIVSKVMPTIATLSVADPGAASGLLKLAGCNIYGRMYRVGRIISELSGPCLECMCTDVGVQCRPLKC